MQARLHREHQLDKGHTVDPNVSDKSWSYLQHNTLFFKPEMLYHDQVEKAFQIIQSSA